MRRDKHDVGYGDSISAFMDDIGDARLVVTVISDKYLKSPYCLRELYSVFVSQERVSDGSKAGFRKAILPVVLTDASSAWKAPKNGNYIRYWQGELEERKRELSEHGYNLSPKRYSESHLVQDFAAKVDTLLWLIGDLNTLTVTDLRADDFYELRAAAAKRVGREPPLRPEKVLVSEGPSGSVEAHRHDLRLLVEPPAHRRAIGEWLEIDEAERTSGDAFATRVEQSWKGGALLDRLFVVDRLVEALVKEGLNGEKAAKAAEELLFVLLPLHPDAPDKGACLGPDVLQGRKLGAPVKMSFDEDCLEAMYAVEPPVGRGLVDGPALVRAFLKELAARRRITPARAEGMVKRAAQRYRTQVEYQRKRERPIDEVERPFYLRIPESALTPEVRDELERALKGFVEVRSEDGAGNDIEEELALVLTRLRADLGDGSR